MAESRKKRASRLAILAATVQNSYQYKNKRAWDAFIQASVAGPQLRARLELFRFSQENEDSAPLSDIPRTLLLDAMNGA